jgi:predicted tellurium resistance membrane protein TerC
VTLRDVHADFSWVVVGANAAVGAWALAAHWLERLRTRHLWVATVAAEVTIVVQVVLGVALVAIEDVEVEQFHAFYGFVALAAIGIIYSYRHQLRPHLFLLYGLGGLFLMGLALRAITISPVPSP